MLAAPHRLTASTDFREAVRRGTRSGGRLVVLHLRVPSSGAPDEVVHEDPARVGLVVSRAVGGSVVRNRVKRRLRHLARERLHLLPPGSLLVLRAQPGAASATYAELGAELDRGLQRTLDRLSTRVPG